MKYSIYLLTCKDHEEAEAITRGLLNSKLAACVKKMPVESSYIWEGKVETNSEVMLMIESSAEQFTAINLLLKKLHSYKTYVLSELPINQLNPEARTWLAEGVGHNE